jgi:hypothetical protein
MARRFPSNSTVRSPTANLTKVSDAKPRSYHPLFENVTAEPCVSHTLLGSLSQRDKSSRVTLVGSPNG